MPMRCLVILSLLLLGPLSTSHAAPSYLKRGDGTVVDFEAQILWQQQSSNKAMTWKEAQSYCAQLKTGPVKVWSLPTSSQLKKLQEGIAQSREAAAMFLGTQPLPYWSSSEDAKFNQNAWVVDFGSGMLKLQPKKGRHYVRCVR